MAVGSRSEAGTLERVVLKHARDAFASDDSIAGQWRQLGYRAAPDFARAVDEYDRFAATLEELCAEVSYLPPAQGVGLDSIYVRDAAVACGDGMILCSMGKAARRAEPAAAGAALRALGTPVHGAIEGEGRLEGGDVVWLDERTLVVGRGYRTNDEGIRQLRELLGESVDDLITVPLPHWRGPGGVFHVMSIFSPIDHDLALVYSPLLPIPFREYLVSRDMKLVEVPDSEFETMACNALAVGLRRCIVLVGNPETRKRLERAGVDVHEYEGSEISVKGQGGPTCLTCPISREYGGERRRKLSPIAY